MSGWWLKEGKAWKLLQAQDDASLMVGLHLITTRPPFKRTHEHTVPQCLHSFYVLPFLISFSSTSTLTLLISTSTKSRNSNICVREPPDDLTGMLLRFRGRDGQFRLEVNPSDTFNSLTSRIAEHLPKDADLSTLTVSNRPQGGDARRPADLKGISLGRVGLR
jgi:hypothetical protein